MIFIGVMFWSIYLLTKLCYRGVVRAVEGCQRSLCGEEVEDEDMEMGGRAEDGIEGEGEGLLERDGSSAVMVGVVVEDASVGVGKGGNM